MSVCYLLFFLLAGIWIARLLLPARKAIHRLYLGMATGFLLYLWLPVLWAFPFRFGITAHLLAAGTAGVLCLGIYPLRDKRTRVPWNESDWETLKYLALTVLPVLAFSLYLEYTHTLQSKGGTLWVGQSTYGDLQLHLAIAASAVDAPFPLQNSLLAGESQAYPFLADTAASSLMVLGMEQVPAMLLSAGVMLFLVFTGFALLSRELCRRKGAALLAFFLLFLNGGLGFLYTLDSTVDGYAVTGIGENLQNVLTGYYQTPTNQPDPHNLRWVNLICDMLIPQRSILCGWSLLMPALLLLLPPLCRGKETPTPRETVLLGFFGGAMPLAHTHSYVALVLASAGFGVYHLCTVSKEERKRSFAFWGTYAGLAAALSLPQLILVTFRHTAESENFLCFWFNWANNRLGTDPLTLLKNQFSGGTSAARLSDEYLWFYLKNIGLPYVMILLSLFRRKPADLASREEVTQNRLLACGGFLIYALAEVIRFQPNVYDNNKLFYVWFLLCLPGAADWGVEWFGRLKGLAGRRVLALALLVVCFLSAGLTLAREAVSSYQVYGSTEVETAEFIRENTNREDVFLTGTHHLNPVTALAGRTIVCGPDLYLYYHGYSTGERQQEIARFYADPAANEDVLEKYGVAYLYVSAYERANYDLDEEALAERYPLVWEKGSIRIYAVED